MTPTIFKPSAQKSSGLYALVGLLVILLAFVAVTFYLIIKQSRNEQEWIRLATDLQVQSQQLAKSASEAVEGGSNAFLELGDSRGAIAGAMEILKNGNAVKSVPKLPGAMSRNLGQLDKSWSRMSANATNILEREALVLKLAAASTEFVSVIPEIQSLTDSAVRDLTRSGASNQQLFVAGRQLVLSDRILRHLKDMLRGGSGAVAAADNFTKEIDYFEQMLNALLQGRPGEKRERSQITGTGTAAF